MCYKHNINDSKFLTLRLVRLVCNFNKLRLIIYYQMCYKHNINVYNINQNS